MAEINCPECDHPLPDTAHYCPYCGLENPGAKIIYPEDVAGYELLAKRKRIPDQTGPVIMIVLGIIFLALIVGIVLLIAGIIFFSQNQQEANARHEVVYFDKEEGKFILFTKKDEKVAFSPAELAKGLRYEKERLSVNEVQYGLLRQHQFDHLRERLAQETQA